MVAIRLMFLGVAHASKLFDKQNGRWVGLKIKLGKICHRQSLLFVSTYETQAHACLLYHE